MSGGKTSSIFLHMYLWLYLQRGSPNWYARVTYGGRTWVRSTHTTDLKLAKKFAESFFIEVVANGGRGEQARASDRRARNYHFEKVADELLVEKRPGLCDREWRNLRNLLISPYGPATYFRGKHVAEINTEQIKTYLRSAEEHSSKGKLSPFTLKRHVSAISGVLKLAAERQLIAAVPPMPRIKTKDSPRAYFTQSEYRRLCSTAHSLAQRGAEGE